MPELSDQVALVTGAGRGIGREIALALARAGVAVGLVARTENQLRETAECVRKEGGRAHSHAADLTDAAAVADAFADVESSLGPIDLLVNNAGANHALGPLQDADPDTWWRDIEFNLKTAFLCTHAVLAGMLERCQGRVVFVASHSGVVPLPESTAYSSAKAALLRLTDALARDLPESGVRFFAISPGMVRTQLMDDIEAKLRRTNPGFSGLPESAFQPIEAAGELVAAIAAGRADPLNGRYIHVLEDLDVMIERADEIVRDDLYVLRSRR